MNWKRHLTRSNAISALAGIILAAMHLRGDYRKYAWYDNAAHFAGGIMVGGAVTGEDSSLTYDLLLTLGIAGIWEMLEVHTGHYPYKDSVPGDTRVEDAVLDTILVLAGAYLMSRGQ